VTAGAPITRSLTSSGYTSGGGVAASGQRTLYSFPVDLSWEADLWGSVRRNVNAASAQAQATAADLANATLSYQSALAQDYFLLHGTDGDIDLLQHTVQIYGDYLKLTHDRFGAGIASDLDVAQAESQLETAQAELINLGVARAQFEHAIAVLTGRPPAAGFQSSSFTNWFTWPSRFFSIGPSLAETVFDAGKRRATMAEFRAAYDATVAAYRQTVLTGFQQVEDALAAERILQQQSVPVDQAVKSAQRALDVATSQYKAGPSLI